MKMERRFPNCQFLTLALETSRDLLTATLELVLVCQGAGKRHLLCLITMSSNNESHGTTTQSLTVENSGSRFYIIVR